MLRKIFSLLVGKERYEPQSDDKALDEQDSPYLNEIKSSLQSDFSFLYVNYGFQIVGERRVGPDGCFIVLQNEVIQLGVSSGGALALPSQAWGCVVGAPSRNLACILDFS